MAYALFAQNKLVITAQLNDAQLQQTMKADEQLSLATQQLALSQQTTSIEAGQAAELVPLFESMANEPDEDARNQIQQQVYAIQNKHKQELAMVKAKVYEVSVKEKCIEMDVKRLDTLVTALQEQLQAVQDAEGQGIKNATPKFKGIG